MATATRGSRAAPFPIERSRLRNGLRVLVAPERSAPIVGVSVVYNVGFRSEPEGRTGFAHLFEHLMFQGSAAVPKLEHMRLVESAGGVFNGHTIADATAYYQALPSDALELAMFLEADRMRALALNEENLRNQVAVVEEEIRSNVDNQPYGGFPWIVLPGLAFDSFPNAHNGYGDFAHLERSTVEEATEFYETYYAPSNAVLTVAGDCDPPQVLELAERHFGGIPASPAPAMRASPERPLRAERRRIVDDPLAPQPAFVAGYRTRDPMGELDHFLAYVVTASVLADGDASRLRARLVHREHSVTDVACLIGVFGGDGLYMRDPVLFQVVVNHPGTHTTDELLAVVDEELSRLASQGPSADELDRVATGYAAHYWRGVESVLERSIALGTLEAVHGRAELAGELPERIAAVPSEAVAKTASALARQHRAVVEIRPAKGAR